MDADGDEKSEGNANPAEETASPEQAEVAAAAAAVASEAAKLKAEAEAADAAAEAEMPPSSAVNIPVTFNVKVPAFPLLKRETSTFEVRAPSADKEERLQYPALLQKLQTHVISRDDPELKVEAFRASVYHGDVMKECRVVDEPSWNHVNRLIIIVKTDLELGSNVNASGR